MVSLKEVAPGSRVRILRLDAQPETSQRLREIGFRENAVVRCLQTGPALLCQIQHARIGLSGTLAGQILVEPLR